MNLVAHFPKLMVYLPFWPETALKLGKITHDLIDERMKKNVEGGLFIDRLKEHKAKLGNNQLFLNIQNLLYNN